MNASFKIVKKSIILCDNELQIYHAGIIDKIEEYDLVLTKTMWYLHTEGFLEDHPVIDDIHVFDYAGKQVVREKCR